MTIYEVRYDDDESYHVAARYTDKGEAEVLCNRLLAAHQGADKDDCHVDGDWAVVEVDVNDTTPDDALPGDLFDVDGEGHAFVNIDRLPLARWSR